MDKSKDNLDDDNKMEKYESNFDYDPQKYCRFCDGNLRGIRHLVECRRNREKESENDREIANNELPRRPLELGVSKVENEKNKTAKNETKEDNFVKRSQTREEKNHETLAEKVSKLENEGEEINDIVKEVEKAEKLMEIIRDLENRDLSDQDRLTLKFAQEKLIERANQIKDLVKKKEEIVKNETAENELKVEVSDKVESDENEQEAKQGKDFIKKREDVVENETKEKEEEEAESDKVDDKESDLETNQEESRSVFEENDKEEVKGEDVKEKVKVKNENEDDKETVKVKEGEENEEVKDKDEDSKEKALDDKELKILGRIMAKTLWLSDEGTLLSPSATPHPPTGQTYTPATDTTPPGSRYDVSAKSCDLGASGRCPVTATSISGQLCQMFFITREYMGIFSPGLFKFFWSMPACSTGEPPPRITLLGLTKLVKFFWSTPACSTGEPPPRFTLPPAISSTDLG